jgi:3-oxoadipate CoA-transferase alpha subunit
MAINKIVDSLMEAVDGIQDGATILVSGFGNAGSPNDLLEALLHQGAKDLTLVSNNAGTGNEGMASLFAAGRVRKIVCSYPRSRGSIHFDKLFAEDKIELDVVPQGTLSERIRAAGAGIGGFYTPTAVGTKLGEGKEVRELDGRPHVLELPIKGDVALIQGQCADRWGNTIYRKAMRNFGPVMAAAADLTVIQVREIVELGDLDPENIVTPSIYVDRLVQVNNDRVWDI